MSQTLNSAPSFNAYQFETVNGNVMGVGRFIIESFLKAMEIYKMAFISCLAHLK